MQTEDYILNEDSSERLLLPKKHVIAIGSTAFIACSLYFLLPAGMKMSGTVTEPHGMTYQSDSSVFDEILDPTRSLTDVLLSPDHADEPATLRDVALAGTGVTQEVFTREGELENYDDADVDTMLSLDAERDIEKELEALAAASGASTEKRPYGPEWVTEEVKKGDTLSSIFSDMNIPYIILQRIADNGVTSSSDMTNLRPGNKLYFSFDKDNNLLGFVKQINGDEQWHFSRDSAEVKEFTVKREPSGSHILMIDENGNISTGFSDGETPLYKKRGRLVVATVNKGESFSVAAHSAGLTYSEIQRITGLFSGRVQFSKHIQPGDTLRVLFSEDKGEGKINAIELHLKKFGTLAAYRNVIDDKFYDERGYNSSATTFRRIPLLSEKVVISSHFNPQRRHPITGMVRPHNGTDFAVRVGTPVIAPADGVVEVAKYSRSAGYYIKIRHRGNYSTVYMHLSKLNVKAGDRVLIGQTIARSGNTGMSTGPHLHYELRRNNQPVNAMRITLPANEDVSVSSQNRQRFANNVALFKKELYQEDLITQNN